MSNTYEQFPHFLDSYLRTRNTHPMLNTINQ